MKLSQISAWSARISDAPKDGTLILMRHPDWDCPAVVKWTVYDEWSGWTFAESVLSDIAGSVEDEELQRAEWALLPA